MSAFLPTVDARPPSQTERRCLIALLVLAALLRLAVIGWKPESLAEDRDLYWGIAKRLAAGDGFVHPDLGHPTAYRPPLYPLMLAGIAFVGGGPKTLGIVQIGLSVAMVWLTWRLGQKLGLKSHAWLGAAFVAVNPLLIQATALAMTETLCAFLLLGLLLNLYASTTQSRWMVGALFGLTALCRPTVWAFAVLVSVVSVASGLRLRSKGTGRPLNAAFHQCWPIVLACGLTLAPWVIRNQLVLGQPIVTTTHGGYTLLLGNNDEAYRAEIAEPTGLPWDSREWQNSLRAPVGHREYGEPARDRWMSHLARSWIRHHPREFSELCWLRVKRFWSVFPGGTDAGSLPMFARWGIAVFFAIELLFAAIGVWRLRRDEWMRWWPLVLLVLSFALVHVIYWSNLRMRAPVEPVLALLAARGLIRDRVEGSHSTAAKIT